MKKSLMLSLLLTTLVLFGVKADQIKFHKSWDEAKTEAARTGKPIFVDFYTTWCGPCVWMSKNTFTDSDVIEYFNENFVSLKIDCDEEEFELQESIGLDAYPTLGYFNSNGDFIRKDVGALGAEDLLTSARRVVNALGDTSPLTDLEDENLAFKFEQLQSENPDKADRLAQGWVKSITFDDLDDENAWYIASRYARDYNQSLFSEMISKLWLLVDMYDTDDFLAGYIDEIFAEAIEASPESVPQKLKTQYLEIVRGLKIDDKPEGYYEMSAELTFYAKQEKVTEYTSVLKSFTEKYDKDDWEAILDNVDKITSASSDEEDYRWALSWIEKAIELEENVFTVYNKAYVHSLLGEKDEALKAARRAKELTDNEDYQSELDNFIAGL